MNPQRWYAQHQHLLGSQFEHAFFENVLVMVPGLDFSCLQAQMPFVDDDGKQRYCDFAIREGTEVRIAIEIDGYDKRGTGAGMTHADFIDWQRRQAALTAQGWHVLRFANRDVYNDAERCINNLRSLLVSLRRKEAANIATQPAMESAPAQKAPNTKNRKRHEAHIKRGLKKGSIVRPVGISTTEQPSLNESQHMKNNIINFLYLWGAIIIANQVFIFGACFQPYCIMAALPHTLALTAFAFFGYHRYIKNN